jgi:uncharacterized membrane protein YcaP (DUF421 family)
MDPLRIAVRVAFTFVFVLVLIRASGKRTISQGDVSSFIVALVIGDLFDDMFWAEVPAAEFIVAAGTFVTVHMLVATAVTSSSMRGWLRRARERT